MEQKTEERKEIKIKYKTVMEIIIVIEVLVIIGALIFGFAR